MSIPSQGLKNSTYSSKHKQCPNKELNGSKILCSTKISILKTIAVVAKAGNSFSKLALSLATSVLNQDFSTQYSLRHVFTTTCNFQVAAEEQFYLVFSIDQFYLPPDDKKIQCTHLGRY